MNFSSNQKIEMTLGRMEPAGSMPEFSKVWDKFQEAGGMPERTSDISWNRFFRIVFVPVFAALIAAVIWFRPFMTVPFNKECEWFNKTDHYMKLNWKGHAVAVSPGGHWKLNYPDAENRSTIVYLYSGKLLCHPEKLTKEEKFVVVLPDAEVSVKGTIFSVKIEGADRKVTVAEGKVWVRLNGKQLTNILTAGQTMEWKGSVVEQGRKADGEDLSDLLQELGMDREMVKTWSVRLKGEKAYQSGSKEQSSSWFVSGMELWKVEGKSGAKMVYKNPMAKTLTHVVVNGERVLLASADGSLWTVSQDGKDVKPISNPPAFRPYTPPVFFGKYVAYPTMDADIWFYDIIRGRRGTIHAPEGDTVFSSPYIENDIMYFITGSGRLVAYDLKTEKVMNIYSVSEERLVFPVVKSGDYLLIFDRKNGRIAYVNKDTGKTLATVQSAGLSGFDQYPLVADANAFWYDPNDMSGTVLKSDIVNHQAQCVRFTGIGSRVNGLAVFQDRVYISSEDGKLTSLSKDGKTIWEKPVKGKVFGTDRDGIYIINGSLLEYDCLSAL